MELQDCAFSVCQEIIASCDPEEAFKDLDVALLVGAMPRRQGMERKDLLEKNAGIFKAQGKALDKVAKKSVKVLVVGNPANTNALTCMTYAPSIPRENFTALTRLDMNRAKYQLAAQAGVGVGQVHQVIIWGNHSSTQFPDAAHATVNGRPATEVVDATWLKDTFVQTVQQRGAAIINARKLSSAMSAANAIVDHMRDWLIGSDEVVSMGVISDGNSYGVPEGLIYSFPVRCSQGSWQIVNGLSVDDYARHMMDLTANELVEERSMALTI